MKRTEAIQSKVESPKVESADAARQREYGLEGRIGGGSGQIAARNSGYVMLNEKDK